MIFDMRIFLIIKTRAWTWSLIKWKLIFEAFIINKADRAANVDKEKADILIYK